MSFVLGDADHAERLVADPQRHEKPRQDRQRAGVGAGRLVMTVGPARRRHRAASSASSGGQAAVSSRSSSCASSTTTGRPRLAWISLAAPSATASRVGKPGQPAGEFVEPAHGPHAAGRNLRLLAHPAGQGRGDDRDDQKDHQREQFVRLGDREGVERLDEEEIVDEERQHRRIDRRPDAETDGGEQHRHAGRPSRDWGSASASSALRRCRARPPPRASHTEKAAAPAQMLGRRS